MPKETWMIASALTVALLLGLLGFSSWDKKQRLEGVLKEMEAARLSAAANEAEASQLKDKLALSQTRVEELQNERDTALQTHRSLEDEMRAALESKDVTISQLQGKLTVNILDRVLFDSGEAELKPDGASVLRKIAVFLSQHPKLKVHVIGHTDNVPIRASAHSRFASNWELSAGRAIAAVRFLSEKAGVDPSRLGAVGYGEFRPIADNSTSEGRARNRRIAITILSEEMAGSDASELTRAANTAVGVPSVVMTSTNVSSESVPESLTMETHAPAK
jgi:chemotaxis protein MotB